MKFLNYEIIIKKRFILESYLFDFLDSFTSPRLIESPEWKYNSTIEKRLRVMSNQILPYVFRDMSFMMIRCPDEAPTLFKGILLFIENFRKDMIEKGANKETIKKFDEEVEQYILDTMNVLKNQNEEVFNKIKVINNDKGDMVSRNGDNGNNSNKS